MEQINKIKFLTVRVIFGLELHILKKKLLGERKGKATIGSTKVLVPKNFLGNQECYALRIVLSKGRAILFFQKAGNWR